VVDGFPLFELPPVVLEVDSEFDPVVESEPLRVPVVPLKLEDEFEGTGMSEQL